ncbi:MAG: acetyl-CoA carboxylase biotin carboxyl carrier protein subunit [candidate division Zixibacteria bacterium]|nr:acetyl-CoA carboxylase biotin carboxyl carrier protein subunit [candidate division Zixibacteria bacterium]
MKKVQVSTADRSFAFELWFENGRYFVRGEGGEHVVDLIPLRNNRYSLIIDGRSYETGVEVASDGYVVFTGARSHRFIVEDYEIAQMKRQAGIDDWAREMLLTAPMPGLVLAVNCRPGDRVEKNQPLLVMEAMKMENDIKSPLTGIIRTVAVAPGQNVDKNQTLIEFEPWRNPEKPVPE